MKNKLNWIIALIFGVQTWAIIASGVTIPIGLTDTITGAPFVISPAEIPITICVALTGIPGVMISTLAIIINFVGGSFGRILGTGGSHILVGIWMVYAYRYSFYHTKMPLRLLAWIGMIIVYFLMMVVLFPILNFNQYQFNPTKIQSFLQVAFLPAVYEMIGTALITTIIWAALPEKYRKPLWINSKPAASSVK